MMDNSVIHINNNNISVLRATEILIDTSLPKWEKEVYCFILEWFNKEKHIGQQTSGSTGTPKLIQLKKTAMLASAHKTISFFKLQAGDTALLCLPSNYIAGKMMLVRSLAANLKLLSVEPSGTPQIPKNKIHLAAMVPLQVRNLIDSGYDFGNIENLIIGGAGVNPELSKALQSIPTAVYASYGMTETCSHIALQRLNGLRPDNAFKLLPGFSISVNQKACLLIDAPEFYDQTIETSDIVEIISEKEFRWLGRADNVINSGGIKIVPEQLEQEISELIKSECLVVPMPDARLGQKAVLIVEQGKTEESRLALETIKAKSGKRKTLGEIFGVEQFVRNASMKIDRKRTIELLFNKM